MRKVMLVIDDIQQMTGLEAFLRRLGFDVLTLGKDSQVPDALLSFTPEIVIASARGRNVDGPKLSVRVKKLVTPPPRVAICFSGTAPILSAADLNKIDALLELPLAGEAGIRLLAQLANVPFEPLFEKFRKFASAKLTKDEEIVVVTGAAASTRASAPTSREEWDPQKNQGRATEFRSERSNRYDRFLESRAEDLKGGAADGVMPRDRANALMSKLKKDSESEKADLDRIQAEKIKFAEALFSGTKTKKP